jgi:uncharacterized protein with PIN domain
VAAKTARGAHRWTFEIDVKRANQLDFSVRFSFNESLRFFLPKNTRGSLGKILREKTSVKDAIESCGVPHPEVDLILIDGSPVDFAFQLRREHEGEILGVRDSPERFQDARMQTRKIARFVADGHLGKLVRFLRLLGIDVAYDRLADDRKLLEIAVAEKRALLTRDRRLLMHSIVQHGYYPRSQMPDEQMLEVVRRFQLSSAFAPYTRCLHCNAALDSVSKSEIFSQLEPLTQIYYEDFRRCAGCGKIYWPGSHFPKLQARIAALREQLQLAPAEE